MARLEATWTFPRFSGYSVLNAINPAICWQRPINNPLIRSFAVQMRLEEEDLWVDLGETSKNYAYIDTQDYSIRSSYVFRIATLGNNQKKGRWSYSRRYIASPLRFDFTAFETARLPSGEEKPNLRLFFLLF